MSGVNEVNMAKWIVALRSGEYKQGSGRLRRDDSFCCMGVACDISGAGTWSHGFYETPAGPISMFVLHDEVREWLGLAYSNPNVRDALSCGEANDDEHWSFCQIADGLESTYLPGRKAEEILAGAA